MLRSPVQRQRHARGDCRRALFIGPHRRQSEPAVCVSSRSICAIGCVARSCSPLRFWKIDGKPVVVIQGVIASILASVLFGAIYYLSPFLSPLDGEQIFGWRVL